MLRRSSGTTGHASMPIGPIGCSSPIAWGQIWNPGADLLAIGSGGRWPQGTVDVSTRLMAFDGLQPPTDPPGRARQADNIGPTVRDRIIPGTHRSAPRRPLRTIDTGEGDISQGSRVRSLREDHGPTAHGHGEADPAAWPGRLGAAGAAQRVAHRGCQEAVTVAAPQEPPEVQVTPVVQQDVPSARWVGTTVGYVTAQIRAHHGIPREASSTPRAPSARGRDLLFRIDPRPYQAVVDQDEANLAQAQAQLEQSRAQLAQRRPRSSKPRPRWPRPWPP